MMTDKEFEERSSEDFKFLVICNMKNNMGMYELLRDREVERERERRSAEREQPKPLLPLRNEDKEERTA